MRPCQRILKRVFSCLIIITQTCSDKVLKLLFVDYYIIISQSSVELM